MTSAFFNFGITGVFLLLLVLALTIAVANYGRNTALGFWGVVLICILGSPLLALIVVLILKARKKA